MPQVSHRRLLQLLDSLQPSIRNAFLAAIADAREAAGLLQTADLLARGLVDDVIQALGIDEALFSQLTESVRSAYMAGGIQGISEMPAALIIRNRKGLQSAGLHLRFDIRNPGAESWLVRESSRLVREIVSSQRHAIREVLAHGLQAGSNPRQTALNLVGRVGPSGRRTGGVLGLTGQQAQYVMNARADLSSGDPQTMARYFQRKRRDHRFDAMVQRAIDGGQPLSAADIDRITGRYADRLLQLRGEMIARTESLNALNEAREQSFRQAIDSGMLKPQHVVKGWSATKDLRTRDSHLELDGKKVAINEPFESPTGAHMMHPGDTSLGAGGEDVIGCRCMTTYKVDMIAATLGV